MGKYLLKCPGDERNNCCFVLVIQNIKKKKNILKSMRGKNIAHLHLSMHLLQVLFWNEAPGHVYVELHV